MLGSLLDELKEVFVNGKTRWYRSEIQDGGGETENTRIHIRTWNIQASIHDNSEIATATPMFSGSSFTLEPVLIMCSESGCEKFNMATINRKWIENNWYLSFYAW